MGDGSGTQQKGFWRTIVRLYTEVLLLRDVTWVYLVILLICFVEGERIAAPDSDFTVFKVK